jgi:hypothetical protein
MYRDMEQRRCEQRMRVSLPAAGTWSSPSTSATVTSVIFDESGRKLGVYCFGQNITTQKQEEEKYLSGLSRSWRKTHPVLPRHLPPEPDPQTAASRRQIPERGGAAAVALRSGGRLFPAAGVPHRGCIHPAETFSRKFSCAALLESFARGTERVSLEYPTSRDGVRRWREGLLFMMRNPRTGEVEAITYAMDIDARKRTELALEKLIHENFDYIGLIHPRRDTFEFISRRPWVRFGAVGEELDYEACRDYVRSRFTDGEELRRFGAVTDLDHILQACAGTANAPNPTSGRRRARRSVPVSPTAGWKSRRATFW